MYLLGDLFEYWPGDDDIDSAFPQQICQELKRVAELGTQLFWMGGNRDFLIGPAFAAAAGMTLLSEPHIAELGEQKSCSCMVMLSAPTILVTWHFVQQYAIQSGKQLFLRGHSQNVKASSPVCDKAVVKHKKKNRWKSWT